MWKLGHEEERDSGRVEINRQLRSGLRWVPMVQRLSISACLGVFSFQFCLRSSISSSGAKVSRALVLEAFRTLSTGITYELI